MGPSFKVQHYILGHVYQVWDIIQYIQFHEFQFWGHFHLVRLLGWCVWKSLISLWVGVAGTGYGCGGGVASLGLSWMQRYSLLSGTSSSSHMGLSSTAIGRSSSSSSGSATNASGVFHQRLGHQQAPSQNGRPLGCLRVKGESWYWVPV